MTRLSTVAEDHADIVQRTDIESRVPTQYHQVRLRTGRDYSNLASQVQSGGATLPERLEDECLGPARQLNETLGSPGEVVIVLELAKECIRTQCVRYAMLACCAGICPDRQ